MALIFFDGFEGFIQGALGAQLQRWDGNISGTIQLAGQGQVPPSPNGRFIETGFTTADIVRKNFSDESELIAGFRVRCFMDLFQLPGPVTELAMCRFIDFNGGDEKSQIVVSLLPSLQVRVRRGAPAGNASGAILGTSSSSIDLKGWQYLEVRVVFSSSGSVQIRQNGNQILSLSGVDTTESANNVCNGFGLIGELSASGNVVGFDDIYINNALGSAPFNTFLGDIRVVELIPNAAGDSTDWTPNGGANWDRNDDQPWFDGDSTIVSSTTDGDKDLYNLTDPDSAATTVRAAKFMVTARKTDPGARSIEVLGKSGSTEFGSAAQDLTEVYVEYTHTELQNPDTSADWTIADLQSLQAGFKIPT